MARRNVRNLEINTSAHFRHETVEPPARRRGREAPEAGVRTDELVAALVRSDLRLVGAVRIAAKAVAPSQRLESLPVADVVASVGGNEDAVLLLEQDGVFSWRMPDQHEELAVPAPARRRRRATATTRRVTFHLAASQAELPAFGLDALVSTALGPVVAYVFAFAARIAVGNVMHHLERDVHQGLIHVRSVDPTDWRALTRGAIRFPRERQAKVLLLVHGTFSTTFGSFGAFGMTPWGQEFLRAALAEYDAVLGYDHRTLSLDPLANASDLLTELRKLPHPPVIDAVAYSRGGLVLRSLVEHLLPTSGWNARVERAVFIGCTNAGTLLAEPTRWKYMVDLYTNLAVAAARGLALLPHGQLAGTVLTQVVSGVGALVKAIVAQGLDRANVPGLAAMVPSGEFVQTINQTQSAQPQPADALYYAITSDFKPQIVGDAQEPKEFPARLVLAVESAAATQLIGASNDLVVDVNSMTAIDASVGGYVKDTLDFGANPYVYHLNYQSRPEVAGALVRWLRLPAPQPAALGPDQPQPQMASVIVGPELPAAVDSDFVLLNAVDSLDSAKASVAEAAPSYVVVRRGTDGDYALSAEEFHALAEAAPEGAALESALDLHESDVSGSSSIGEARVPTSRPMTDRRSSARHVLLDRDTPIGVRPADPLVVGSAPEMAAAAARVEAPQSDADRSLRRRLLPTPRRRSVKSEPELPLHFRAEMDSELLVEEITSVDVFMSQDLIAASAGRASAGGRASVVAGKPLTLQLVARANVFPSGTTRVELQPADIGQRTSVSFDIRATHVGEAEVWVIVRQEQVTLLTLELHGRVLAARPAGAQPAPASAEGTATSPKGLVGARRVLYVYALQQGASTRLQYELELTDLGVIAKSFSPYFMGSLTTYLQTLYSQIENRWLSAERDVTAFRQELREFGGQLFDDLFVPEFAQVLWDHRGDLDDLLLYSDDPFVPWELVHLKQPGAALGADEHFLGEKGLVRWLQASEPAPATLRVRPGMVRYIVPDYPVPDWKLPATLDETAFLVKAFTATAVTPELNEVRALLRTPGSFDLLHFAGHGSAKLTDISTAAVMLTGRVEQTPQGPKYIPEPLTATTVGQSSNFVVAGQHRPLVVLNACQVARLGYNLSSIGGFAASFLARGAGAFVASLWSVGDQPALAFVEYLYGTLRSGATMSSAIRAARAAAASAGDGSWLAYAVYALPQATVEIEATGAAPHGVIRRPAVVVP